MSESYLLSITFFIYLLSSIFYGVIFFRRSPNRLKKLSTAVLVVGLLVHTATLIVRAKVSGHAPFTNMYESLVFFSWTLIATYLLAELFLKINRLGFFVLAANLALLVYTFSHDPSAKPLMPALQSNWLALHVITCFLSYGAFAISFLASIIYLTPLHKNFSSREQIDVLIYRLILFGFPLLTLGIASGAVWANEAWGTYWSWDPKETWALITWFIYILYLHLRLMKGWTGTKLVWVALAGFLCVIFTYWGVAYFLPGLHSYAS